MKTTLLSLIAAAALSACIQPAQAYCSVELNGDSVMYGFINQPSTGWRLPTTPAQWLRNYGYSVTDKSAGGLTTYDLVRGYTLPFPEAWPELYPAGPQSAFIAEPHYSQVVVIETGINDFRVQPFSAARVAQDYRYLIDVIRSQGKTPVITGVANQDPNLVDADSFGKMAAIRTAVRNVAAEKGVAYAGWDTVAVAWTDGIHMNQASSNGLADKLRATLDTICRGR